MKKTTVTVRYNHDESDTLPAWTTDTPGLVLAQHRWAGGNDWTITHVASGQRLGFYEEKRKVAAAKAAALAGLLDWTMPAEDITHALDTDEKLRRQVHNILYREV